MSHSLLFTLKKSMADENRGHAEIVQQDCPFAAFPIWIFRRNEREGGYLSAKEMIVILAMQSFASGISSGNSVYPGVERLAAMTSLNRKTVMECVKSLCEKGLIEKFQRRSGGVTKSNLYVLKFWVEPERATSAPRAEDSRSPKQEPRVAPKAEPKSEMGEPKSEIDPSRSPLTGLELYPLNNNQIKNNNQIEAPASRPVASGVCKEKVKPKSKAIQEKAEEAILQIPEEYHKYKDILVEWFIARKRRYRKDPEFTRPSLEGLENAKAYDAKCPGMLKEYLQKAAYAGWLSLGWTGHVSDLEKMYRDKQILSRNNPQTPLPLIKPKATLG